MIICSQFWSNFWPNFASTIGGLILGLPIALWTNRIVVAGQSRKQKNEEKARLEKALHIIKQTLAENKQRLLITREVINDNKVQFETQFDISAWDAVKTDIIKFLHDPLLQKRIAYHFLCLSALDKLNSIYLDSTAIGVSSIITGREQMKESLKTHIVTSIEFLIIDIDEILNLNKVL